MGFLNNLRPPTRERRDALLLQLERWTELPLLLLAFLMIPTLAAPFLWELTTAEVALFSALNIVIWAAFAADLALKLIVSPTPLRYARSHWIDVVVVAVPFMRPLRIVRLLIFGSRAWRGARRLSQTDYVILYGLGAVVIATTVIVALERSENSRLSTFPDAIWWAVVTVTTVGYGDVTPVTTGGRIVAGMLMLVGIGIFSTITANVASRFVRADAGAQANTKPPQTDELLAEIRELRSEIRTLRERLPG